MKHFGIICIYILQLASAIFAQLMATSRLEIGAPWPMLGRNQYHCSQSPFSGTTSALLYWKYTAGNFVSSSPAIASDGSIYVGSSDGYLYAMSGDQGLLLWRFQTKGAVTSSPAIGVDGTVYVGSSDSNVYAISPDGSLQWLYKTGGAISSSPAVGSDGTIYIGSDDFCLYAIKSDGSIFWKYPTNGAVSTSPAVGSDGKVYMGSSYFNTMYAINSDGSLLWSYATLTSETFASYIVLSNPAISAGGIIYVCGNGGDDTIYLLYALSYGWWGVSVDWTFASSAQAFGSGSSPVVASDGTIYFGAGDGYLYAVKPDGTLLWSYKTGGGIFSTPAIDSSGTIYVGTGNNYVNAINSDGTMLWKFGTNNPVYSSAAIGSNGIIYVGSSDFNLYAIGVPSLGNNTNCSSYYLSNYNATQVHLTCISVCDAGSYIFNDACLACPAGTYSTTSNTDSCSLCLPGTYTASEQSLSCSDCLAGFYTPANGSSECIKCPSGTFSVAGSSSCLYTASTCPVGTFSDVNSSACISCSAGTYSSVIGSASCFMCPPGTYSGMNEASACSICPSGYYSSDGSSICLPCFSGEYSIAKSANCSTFCPVGYVKVPQYKSCQECPWLQTSHGDFECSWISIVQAIFYTCILLLFYTINSICNPSQRSEYIKIPEEGDGLSHPNPSPTTVKEVPKYLRDKTNSISLKSDIRQLQEPPRANEELFKMISWENLKVDNARREPIGGGGSSIVYYANLIYRQHNVPLPVAVKIFIIESLSHGEDVYNSTLEVLCKEAITLKSALDEGCNIYVVKLLGICSGVVNEEWKSYLGRNALNRLTVSVDGGEKMFALVTQYEEGGNLDDLMHKHLWVADTRERVRILLQIATGLHCLDFGKKCIIHSDLKPKNILLTNKSANPDVKIADMGLAELKETTAQSSARHTQRERVGGTFQYMAPELFRSFEQLAVKPSRSSDVYALGTIMWEVLSGQRPWDGYSESERLSSIREGHSLQFEHLRFDISPKIRKLIVDCLSIDPAARPPIDRVQQILKDSYDTIVNGRFDIFLSYAWGKNEWRKPLTDKIYEVLNAQGYRVWMDSHNRDGQGELGFDLLHVSKGIDNSDCVVLLLSNEYLKSKMCCKELDHIIDTDKPLFICLVEPNKQGFWRKWKKDFDCETTDAEFILLPSLFSDPDPSSMSEDDKSRKAFLCKYLETKKYADFKESVLLDFTSDSAGNEERGVIEKSVAMPTLLKNLKERGIHKSRGWVEPWVEG